MSSWLRMPSSISDIMHLAYKVAKTSPDPSTQNGAVVLDAEGLVKVWQPNDFPVGFEARAEHYDRPLKYRLIEHAERNAIYDAAARGVVPVQLVCPWAACSDCARGIVQSGIRRLIRHKEAMQMTPEHWETEVVLADTILAAGGVEVVEWSGTVGVEILRDGELWQA